MQAPDGGSGVGAGRAGGNGGEESHPPAERLTGLDPLRRRQRLRYAARATRRRLARRRAPHLGPPFSQPMGWLAMAAVALVLALLPLDGRIAAAMAREPAGVLAFFGIATDVGLAKWYVYPSAALVMFVAFTDWRGLARVGRRRVVSLYAHAGFLLAAVGLAGIATQVLKIVFGRARPALLDEAGPLAFTLLGTENVVWSFPSGHSTTMGAVTLVLMLWFRSLRWPALVAGACFALSRLVVGAHFASDIVAGFTIGALTALTLARWLARRGILFGYAGASRGWRGLLPMRKGHWRDFGASTLIGALSVRPGAPR